MSEGIPIQLDNRNPQQRLIDKIAPLTPSRVEDAKDGVGVQMILPGDTNGVVAIKYEAYDDDFHSPHAVVTSYIEAPGSPSKKDPFQAVAAALTMAATINETAKLAGHPIVHKVLANIHSEPLFARLRAWGMYQYCDPLGEPSPVPVLAENNLRKRTYYSCTFPNAVVEAALGKYANKDAAVILSEKYPTPMRILLHRISNSIKTIPHLQRSSILQKLTSR